MHFKATASASINVTVKWLNKGVHLVLLCFEVSVSHICHEVDELTSPGAQSRTVFSPPLSPVSFYLMKMRRTLDACHLRSGHFRVALQDYICIQMSFKACGRQILGQRVKALSQTENIDFVCDSEKRLNWLAALAFGSNRASLLEAVCSVTLQSVTLQGVCPLNSSHCWSEWYSETRQPVQRNICVQEHTHQCDDQPWLTVAAWTSLFLADKTCHTLLSMFPSRLLSNLHTGDQ